MAMEWLAGVLFTMEVYHFIVHWLVLVGWRALPRRDLVRNRVYFLVDASTVALTCYVVLQRLWWLAVLQNIQHLMYFFSWEKSWFAKRVVSWSSLDWDRSRWQPDLVLGTVFDILVHVTNMVLLGALLSTTGVLAGIITACLSTYVILYNPRLAWSSKASMPGWVQRRLGPITREQAGEDHRLVAAMGWAK